MPVPIHVAVGANHKSASLDLREQMFVSRDETPAFYEILKGRGFHDALLLSTCDRVEVHATHESPRRGDRHFARSFGFADRSV